MHKLEVAFQCRRDGVLQRANRRVPCGLVRKCFELRREQRARLLHGNLHLKEVARWGDGRRTDAVGREERIDLLDSLFCGSNERRYLNAVDGTRSTRRQISETVTKG